MKPSILVADDEPSILLSLQFLLQKSGLGNFRFLQDKHERLDATYASAVVTEGVATEAED